jgi:hypothetical protein
MSNAYSAQGRVWTIDSTGTLWTNTLGTKGSHQNLPKWVTRIIYAPASAEDDLVFQDVGASTTLAALEAGASDTSPITVDFSAENGGKGRRWHSCKVTTIDGGSAYLFVA